MSDSDVEVATEFIRIRASLERAILRKVGSPDNAADLASDMYVKLLRLRPMASSKREAWSYLHQMASSVAIDYIRTQQRRRLILESAGDVLQADNDAGPEQAILAKDEIRVVEDALTALPAKCREILFLSRMYGMTHAEIADRMNISPSLVEKYLARALTRCRDRLREARSDRQVGGE